MRIGELAGLVGISARAIRHYHRIGLLAEPARKANGYREYSLRDAVELARVRRLTGGGHPRAPGPAGPAMAARDRGILALLETAPPARGSGWLSELARVLNSDPGAAEQAYAVYARLDELPARPDLEYYRKQAKRLQHTYETGDTAAQARVADVLGDRAAERFLLSDAQFVLAQEHGFRTWAEFRAHIQSQDTTEDRPVSRLQLRPMIESRSR